MKCWYGSQSDSVFGNIDMVLGIPIPRRPRAGLDADPSSMIRAVNNLDTRITTADIANANFDFTPTSSRFLCE